ncbi:DNA polymerase III subunit alpha [Streptomyces sp. NE06-03E]|uniref:DNA polymerase III subunit alpha n=2 Tax=Streptomyces TaxID=1883 RepID=A0A652KN47_9ACTN|nr:MULTISPECIES: DNA polymerase III subunit alpha [unclassified Streptomyces]WSS60980.1 DNA polymerase III subunit alpha [Streptomyces sp. NBC_01177]WSS68029.1 DNA polymerase III subunit alpha [Streptomyces sp. NBC_01175]WSS75023.1 DNA polymerase III subunit alpha [Streptomyces sp. NBC_01174]MDX3055091.1 DNA polymerase III subunit alpha [Streptomyces sp. NE06-03E]MDX3326360.1 DNA polymerase III subunit alpha [Streptomyces sp. ME02-6979-3A]
MSGFTHLHTVSGFSLRYGASHPERLAERAAERGMDALALTDRDSLAGAVRFARACEEAGIRPLFGAELAVAPQTGGAGRTHKPRTPVRGGAFVDESAPRVTFLARDGARGWAELCRLVSAAHAPGAGDPDAGQPMVGRDALPAEGLTVLLGPASEVGAALAAGRPDRAAALLAPWREIYGDALRLEAVHHGREGTGPGSLRLAARTVGFAAEQGVRAVLTNAVRYADPGQGPVADVLDSARRLVPVDPRRSPLDSGERWLKDARAMRETAGRIASAAGLGRDAGERLLAETRHTADACLVDPADDLGIGSVHFPEPHLVGAGRRTAQRVLASRAAAGMVRCGYDRRRDYWDRMHRELDIIAHHGFASYFLTVSQVVDDVKSMGIRVAARGSGAGSLVNHLLGIAHADPVEHGLLMERFLSKRRFVLPDIDIDVESARRLDVYRAIIGRFGAERVATVSMPETYRVRHAIRDVGAALSMDPAETDRLAKAFPHIRARDARAAMEELPELRAVAGRKEQYGRLWDLVESLDALPRGIAMHPCGVLLSDGALLRRTPVMPTSGEGFPMSQFDKDDVEHLGLLKLDVLGVRMQSAMAHAVTEVKRASGREVDLDAVPQGDPETYRLIRSAETLGCFQIESPGQRDLVGRLQPATFHDLVVDISLFRPGPVAADMVRPFIEARHGRAPVRYPHPDLEEALRDTYGVVVFHEQIIEMVNIMTGCGRGEADRVRRGLSDPDSQARIRVWFAERAARRKYGAEVIARAWEIIEAFGSYGFCKAHAVAFAVPTYQSAWLKAHHPAAFYAGLLTHDPGMYPKRLLLADARRRGVPVLPLDVNRSAATHRIELVSGDNGDKWGLRLALADVHGISEAEVARIEAGQPYTSLLDFWQRARPGKPAAERLAQVGALDAFGANRRDLLLHLSELHRAQRSSGSGAAGAQLPLGGGHRTGTVGLPDLNDAERLSAELGVLSMDVSRHLMGDHHAFLEELGAISAKRLREAGHGETVLVAGAKVATQTPPVRSGRRVIFTTLDDGTGLVDLAFFDDSHAACAHTVFHSWLLLVRGVVQRRGARSLSVVGSAAWNLAELAELRRTGGLDAVAARLAEEPASGEEEEADDGRRIQLPTGYEMNPWSDLQPAGEGTPTGRKLWHQSQGSAG